MSVLFQIAVVVAAVVILFKTVVIINRMCPETDHGIRWAYILASTGSFGEIVAVYNGHAPGIAETLFVVGFGALTWLDRRWTPRCPLVSGECYDHRKAPGSTHSPTEH